MKLSHRSEELDKMLNKHVIITFTDGSTADGVLKWQGFYGPGKPNCYYLANIPGLSKNCVLSLRKSHIKNVREI